MQFTGDSLYEAISVLCKKNGLGIRVRLDSNNQFVFSLHNGIDPSYKQTQNLYAVVSPEEDAEEELRRMEEIEEARRQLEGQQVIIQYQLICVNSNAL